MSRVPQGARLTEKTRPGGDCRCVFCSEAGFEFRCLGCGQWRPFHLGGAPDVRCDVCWGVPLGSLHLRRILWRHASDAQPSSRPIV